MSSAEEDNSAPSSKRRKYPRACDYCRRKKIKCDGPQMPNHRCSKCIYKKIDCSYVEPLHKHFYPSSHVNALENRMQKLERLIEQLKPDIDIAKELEEQEISSHSSPSTVSESSSQSQRVRASTSLLPLGGFSLREETDYEPSEDESELQKVNLIEDFGKVSLQPASYLYHGKSSSMVLLRAAKDLSNIRGAEKAPTVLDQPQAFASSPGPSAEFRWLSGTCPDRIPPFHDFPPPDLMHKLIDLYFAEVNAFSPLLHEPTFRRGVSQGLHLSPGGFGATLLLVCATGARWSGDSRTLGQGTSASTWAGWKWFEQVESVYRSVVAPPDLYDLQIRVLIVQYLQGTTVTHACWAYVGAGIRTGVEMGAHRKKRYGDEPSVEGELLKRAFWILVTQDWGTAFATGRPTSIHDEDMDLPLPVECDDEYWTDASGKPVFKQPPGKPSKISCFICYLRLIQILAYAVRTIYAINKSRVQLRHGDQQWEERTVAELDSALNRWVDAVPDHLRWDPHRADDFFFKQSATLFSHYYLFQITVHRPFIDKRKQNSPLSFTSIVICMNAAKSAVRVLDELYRRVGTPLFRNVSIVFTVAMVLILHILSEKGAGRSDTVDQEIQEVQKCMQMLHAAEQDAPRAKHLGGILALFGIPPPSSISSVTRNKSDQGYNHFARSSTPESSQPASSMESDWRYPAYSSATQNGDVANDQLGPAMAGFDAASCMVANDPMGITSSAGLPLYTDELSKMYPSIYDTAPLAPGLFQGSAPQHSSLEPSYSGNPQHHYAHHAVHQDPFDLNGLAQPQPAATAVQYGASEPYGLDPLGYSQPPSLPSYPAYSASMETPAYHAQQATHTGAILQRLVNGYPAMDDALNTWSTAPSFYGWDDWGPFLNNVGQHGRPSS